MNPRVPLPDDESLPIEIQERLSSMPPVNVFRMVANAPASFNGFLVFGSSIMFESEFDPRKREIAILRVAHVTHSIYEWTQHVTIARMAGVTEEEIEKIASDGVVTALDDEGNLLCRVADEISRDVKLSDGALAQILESYGIRGATELILCVSYYNMISRFLESTRVELEEESILENDSGPLTDRLKG